jgi:hypothetical protein
MQHQNPTKERRTPLYTPIHLRACVSPFPSILSHFAFFDMATIIIFSFLTNPAPFIYISSDFRSCRDLQPSQPQSSPKLSLTHFLVLRLKSFDPSFCSARHITAASTFAGDSSFGECRREIYDWNIVNRLFQPIPAAIPPIPPFSFLVVSFRFILLSHTVPHELNGTNLLH